MVLNKRKENKLHIIIWGSLLIILFVCFVFQNIGYNRMITGKIAEWGLYINGYEKVIYDIGLDSKSGIAIYGDKYVQQKISLTDEMLEDKSILLKLYLGTYGRVNTGELFVQIQQNDTYKVYKLDLSKVKEDSGQNLIVNTSDWQVGDINIKVYAPYSTQTNCIALFVTDDTANYEDCVINGEKQAANACIDVYVPVEKTMSDFEEVGTEYIFQNNSEMLNCPIVGVDKKVFEIYLPEVSDGTQNFVVGFKLFTYARINYGTMQIAIKQGEAIQTFEINMQELVDGQERLFELNSEVFNAGKCVVELSSVDASGDNCVAVQIMKLSRGSDNNGLEQRKLFLVYNVY